MTKVFFPDAQRLRRLGHDAVATVPVLFGEDYRLRRIESRYLRDRATGYWSPSCTVEHPIRSNPPSEKSMEHFAYALAVFVDWCTFMGKDWTLLTYDEVLKFQKGMISGAWSPTGQKLSPKTANFRADEVTAFLTWAAAHQLRPPFDVYYVTAKHYARTGKSSVSQVIQTTTRGGRARVSKTASIKNVSLLPTPEEVKDWLKAVLEQRGRAKYLACKFILEVGTRRFETVAITVDQIPSADVIAGLQRAGRKVSTTELVVTKGGRPRTVTVSLAFLDELRKWIDGRRLALTFRWNKRTDLPPSNRLFLSDAAGYEGTPISADTLYSVFREVKPRPIKWHPHFGRHAYACFSTLHALESEAGAGGRTLRELGADWIHARGSMHLRMLRDQLGHLDEATTEMYLRWIATAVSVQELYESWHDFLSGEED